LILAVVSLTSPPINQDNYDEYTTSKITLTYLLSFDKNPVYFSHPAELPAHQCTPGENGPIRPTDLSPYAARAHSRRAWPSQPTTQLIPPGRKVGRYHPRRAYSPTDRVSCSDQIMIGEPFFLFKICSILGCSLQGLDRPTPGEPSNALHGSLSNNNR